MTLPFIHPEKRRALRVGHGEAFYGWRLRNLLAGNEVSRVERAAEWGRRHGRALTIWWGLLCLAAGLAYGIATL